MRVNVEGLNINKPFEIKGYFQGDYKVMRIFMGPSTYLLNIIKIYAHGTIPTIRISTSKKNERVF